MKHATLFQTKKPKKNSPWCLHDNMEHGSVSDCDPARQFFLKLGLTCANGWDCDAQNVEFTVNELHPRLRVLHGVVTYLI